MKQKFRRYTFVKVKHFPKDFISIVDGSYSQLYGGTQTDIYALFVLEGNKIINRISWYSEELLTALPEIQQSCIKAEEMAEEYNLTR